MKRSRTKNIVSWVLSLAMITAGVALIASFLLAGRLDSTATNDDEPGGFNVPKLETTKEEESSVGPKDRTLKLTVPAMSRVEDDEIPYAEGTDEEKLKNYAAIHLAGTGFPWEEEANVYIAGHRLGYPSTESWLTFFDLNKVDKGDEVFLTDAEGKKYTYKVFKDFTVGPSNLAVTDAMPGKNILTLQTCTLPDYSKRLIIQAELTDTTEKSA